MLSRSEKQSLINGYSRQVTNKLISRDVLTLCLLFYGKQDFSWIINQNDFDQLRFQLNTKQINTKLKGPIFDILNHNIRFQLTLIKDGLFGADIGFEIIHNKPIHFRILNIKFLCILYCKEVNLEIRTLFDLNNMQNMDPNHVISTTIKYGKIDRNMFIKNSSLEIFGDLRLINVDIHNTFKKRKIIYKSCFPQTKMNQIVNYEWKWNINRSKISYLDDDRLDQIKNCYYSPIFDKQYENWCLILQHNERNNKYWLYLQLLSVPVDIHLLTVLCFCKIIGKNAIYYDCSPITVSFSEENNYWRPVLIGYGNKLCHDDILIKCDIEILEAQVNINDNSSVSNNYNNFGIIRGEQLELFGIINNEDKNDKIHSDYGYNMEIHKEIKDYQIRDNPISKMEMTTDSKMQSFAAELSLMKQSINVIQKQVNMKQINYNDKVRNNPIINYDDDSFVDILKPIKIRMSKIEKCLKEQKEKKKEKKKGHDPNGIGMIEMREWLTNIVELPDYINLFAMNGFDSLKWIKEITNKHDLEYIGIKIKAHQIKLMRHIKKLQ